MISIADKVTLLNDLKRCDSCLICYKMIKGISYHKKYKEDEIIIILLDLLDKMLDNPQLRENIFLKITSVIMYLFEITSSLEEKTKNIYSQKITTIKKKYESHPSFNDQSLIYNNILELNGMLFIDYNSIRGIITVEETKTIKKEIEIDKKSEEEKRIDSLNRGIKNRDKRIEMLETENKTIRTELTARKNELKKLEKELELLKTKKTKTLEPNEEVKQIIVTSIENKDDILNTEEITYIQRRLIKELAKPKTKDQLYSSLANLDINITPRNFRYVLKTLQKNLNLNSSILTSQKMYHIEKPDEIRGKDFYIDNFGSYFDSILFTDLHCCYMNKYFKDLLTKLNEYAESKKIKYAFILGDIFDIRHNDEELANIDFLKKWTTSASNLQKELANTSLKYFVLGGNHDERAFWTGLDLMKYLDSENIYSLGYKNASIIFGDKKDFHNHFGLHHTGRDVIISKPFKMDYNEQRKILNYLNKYYNNNRTSYFDFFGHFHYSCVDLENGYCLLPNFQNSNYLEKAYHVRFFLKKNGTIDYLLIKPLYLQHSALQSPKIMYRKISKK